MAMTLLASAIYAGLIVLVYKVFDHLLRIPKIEKPEGKKKNILVTGCDTGFGNLFAKRMSKKGFTVFAGCLTKQGEHDLDVLQRETLRPFILDVTDKASVERGFIYVRSQLPDKEGLWAIVNNAGIVGTSGPFDWQEREDLLKAMDVNVFGMFMVTKAFIPLVKKTRGRVINTCSIVGRFALPYSTPYIVSKYAAEGLSDSLRRELYPFGISLHIMEPGFFATNLTDPKNVLGTIHKQWDRISQDMREEYGEKFREGCGKGATEMMPRLGSRNLNLVLDCYEHAVTAMFPRGRYMPGMDSKYVYFVLSLMPEWLSDWLMYLACRVVVPLPVGAKRYQ